MSGFATRCGASIEHPFAGFWGQKRRGTLREGRYVPFGPFLAGAGIVVMVAGLAPMLAWLGVAGM